MGQLQEKIATDLTNTPIGTEKAKRELLKTLLTEIKLKKGNNPTDDETLAIVRKFKTNAIECGNLSEIPILDNYLPQMLNEAEIEAIVYSIIYENKLSTPKDLGVVMLKLKDREDFNLIDKKFASAIAKDLLSK